MDICEDCVLYGRCSGSCSDSPNYNETWEKENDLIDYIEAEGE